MTGDGKVGERAGVVAVAADEGAADEAFVDLYGVQVFFVKFVPLGVVGDALVGGTRVLLPTTRVVGQNQAVAVLMMFKPPADAPFGAQPGKEGKVAFAVLGLIVAARKDARHTRQAFFDQKGVVGQDFVEDL